MPLKQIKECPKCQVKAGWYWRHTTTVVHQYDSGGKIVNSEPKTIKRDKKKFCSECFTDITNCIGA